MGDENVAWVHRRFIPVIAILGNLVSAAAAPALGGRQPQPPLIVAYMTSGGELVPIARYDGRVWRNTWPEPIPDDAPLPVRTVSGIPTSWLDQRVPSRWTAWSAATRKQQPVTVMGVDRDGSCVEAITLATSFKPDRRSDGLAFNRPTTVDAIIALEQTSGEWDVFGREVAPHFTAAIAKPVHLLPGSGQDEMAAKVLARARADKLTDDGVVVKTVFRDPQFPVMFIEAEREFDGIPPDTDDNALSYGGWFRRNAAGALIPIGASVGAFSTAEGKLPRYTPLGILRLGAGAIWVMSEWGIESQTIVLFQVSATRVRQLTSALISGC